MSSFFADENAVQVSPNLDVEVISDDSLKPAAAAAGAAATAGGGGVLSASSFLSPERTIISKSMPSRVIDLNSVDRSDDKEEHTYELPVSTSATPQNLLPALSTRENTGDRIRRENEESEQLAWEMMREESASTYRMQMEFMKSGSNEMSAEDLEAIQMAMSGGHTYADEEQMDEEVMEEDGDEDEMEEEDEESDISEWDYDRLLALGEVIGDVKTERWRLKSQRVIKSLQRITFAEVQRRQRAQNAACNGCSTATTGTSSSSASEILSPDNRPTDSKIVRFDPSCAVCMEIFVPDDKLALLPCQHYYHEICTQGWLADHNSCPMCKSAVYTTPEK